MDRLSRFRAARNYALYYGNGRAQDLALFDAAVVEPSGQNEESLHYMQNSETLVLAYLSVMEVPPRDPALKYLGSGGLLEIEGRPAYNHEFGNYLADLRSPRWTGMLMHRAGLLLNREGYDGLFLDTIGNVESPAFPPPLRDSLLLGAANFVRDLRNLYSGHIIVQNNGLEKLCLLTSGYVNGICWENPAFGEGSRSPWIESVVSRLESIKKKGVKILLLIEEKENNHGLNNYRIARETAEKSGFIMYRAPAGYTGGVNLPGNGEGSV